MSNFEKALLLIAGIAIGAVVVFILTRPKIAGTSYTVKEYNNVEEWKIIKDKDGRVQGVSVHRNAKETA